MKTPIATITSDIHGRSTTPRARTDNYFEALMEKLQYIKKCRSETFACSNVPHLDAGDLFHSWKSTPEVEVMLIENLPRPFVSIPGNHEMPYHSRERLKLSSFQVLSSAFIIDEPIEHGIAAYPYGADLTEPVEYESYKGFNIALYHGMVWPGNKPPIPGIEGISAKDLLAALPQYDLIITGHNHQCFTVKDGERTLLNPGSVMRSSIDQIDYHPAFHVLYSDGSIARIPFKAKQDVFAVELYEAENARSDRIDEFVASLKNAEGFSLSFEANVRRYCEINSVPDPVRNIIYEILED